MGICAVSAAAAERGDQQKPRSQGDAKVGCIERRPVPIAPMKIEPVHHGPMPHSIKNIAERAAENCCIAHGLRCCSLLAGNEPGEKGRSSDANNNKKAALPPTRRSEEHTSELQSPDHLVCRL